VFTSSYPQAVAKHGVHTPTPQTPGVVHPPDTSLHINQHGVTGRLVWAGGPAAAAAAAQGHAGAETGTRVQDMIYLYPQHSKMLSQNMSEWYIAAVVLVPLVKG
jgi:hypothetical protein